MYPGIKERKDSLLCGWNFYWDVDVIYGAKEADSLRRVMSFYDVLILKSQMDEPQIILHHLRRSF